VVINSNFIVKRKNDMKNEALGFLGNIISKEKMI
jgi:hypothetical protein